MVSNWLQIEDYPDVICMKVNEALEELYNRNSMDSNNNVYYFDDEKYLKEICDSRTP